MRFENNIKPARAVHEPRRMSQDGVTFEIFVAKGFCEHEASSITHTLAKANDVLQRDVFKTRYVSDTPGLITSRGGQMVRAEPAVDDYGFSDVMVVLGGKTVSDATWIKRVRQMQRQARCVALLSDAAAHYIQSVKKKEGPVTTHWRHAETLRETGYHPNLTDNLAEKSDGIITAAGSGATSELVIGLISPYLDQVQIAEIASHLLLPGIRKNTAEQPKQLSGNSVLFNGRVARVIRVMEDHIADGIDMETVAKHAGMSSRQIERIFQEVFNQSPGKFYKQLRTKKAWALIEETLLPLVDIAVATGFRQVSTMSKAVSATYNISPAQSRARRSVALTNFDDA